MSLGGSLSGISFGGISSGIDTDSIIARLMQLEQVPIQRLQLRQSDLTTQLGLMSTFRSKLGAVSAAIAGLSSISAFSGVSATSSDTSVADITATSGAAQGVFSLAVLRLAQAHKIGTAGQASTTAALGQAGEFVVNGKAVQVGAGDSLQDLATKINSAHAGVTARVIDGGPGHAFLTMTADGTGAKAQIQLADSQGSVLSTLGLTGGATAFRVPRSGGGASLEFGNTSATLGSLIGLSGAGPTTFNLNGTDVAFDLGTGSLQALADAINNSGSGAQASIAASTSGGQTTYHLDLTGVTSFTDPGNVLHDVGLLQDGFQNELLAAQDAQYKLDGVQLESATNTITNVISGTTITLKKAAADPGAQTLLTLDKDIDGAKGKVQDFVDSYNELIGYIRDNTSFDKDTFDTGKLFANPIVGQVESSLAGVLFTRLAGNSGIFDNLGQLGISTDADGKLTVDDVRLSAALTNNPDAVSAVFRSTGSGSIKELNVLGGTSKTKPSGTAGYQVVITAAAMQHSIEAEAAQAGALAQQETLTFGGPAFGAEYSISFAAGLSQDQVVAQINNDSKLKDLVTASVVGGKLTFVAKQYGAGAQFEIKSDVASGAGGTGWGAGTLIQTGTDVQGTINGEAATGLGQLLTGKSGNANTDGLQISYKGTSTGVIGTVTYARGVADLTTDLIGQMTDSVSGLLTANDKSLQAQIDGIAKQIADQTDRLALKKQTLQAKFARMEQMIAALQAQQAHLAQLNN